MSTGSHARSRPPSCAGRLLRPTSGQLPLRLPTSFRSFGLSRRSRSRPTTPGDLSSPAQAQRRTTRTADIRTSTLFRVSSSIACASGISPRCSDRGTKCRHRHFGTDVRSSTDQWVTRDRTGRGSKGARLGGVDGNLTLSLSTERFGWQRRPGRRAARLRAMSSSYRIHDGSGTRTSRSATAATTSFSAARAMRMGRTASSPSDPCAARMRSAKRRARPGARIMRSTSFARLA
jgi:hypothetical protein